MDSVDSEDLVYGYFLLHESENLRIVKVLECCSYHEAVDGAREFEKTLGTYSGTVTIWPLSKSEFRIASKLTTMHRTIEDLVLVHDICDLDVYDMIKRIRYRMNEYCKTDSIKRFKFDSDVIFLRG